MPKLYPLIFEPELKEKIWGGRKLETILGKKLPPDVPIGESWEAYGGNVVAYGDYRGMTVDQLVDELGSDLLGKSIWESYDGIFPLLFKYIDANEFLSVQVHPDDEYARTKAGYPKGKTESWYIVYAEPGAKLVHGWKKDTSPEEVEDAVRNNKLEELLEYIDVQAGDVVFAPAGTVHAIGGGILLAEIQENSDITYRLYDWGRVGFDGKPRELHIKESLETLDYHATAQHKNTPLSVAWDGVTRSYLVACRYFVAELMAGSGAFELDFQGDRFEILSLVSGAVKLEWADNKISLRPGTTTLVPAALGRLRIVPESEDVRMLRMYVPRGLKEDVVEPLLSAGYSLEQVLALGGDIRHNDIASVVQR